MSQLDDQLTGLATMSLAQLRERAIKELGACPEGYGPGLLRLSIAYKMQARGGERLPPAISRQIRHAMAATTHGASVKTEPPLALGSRLVREWHGHSHHVTVTERGFSYRDRAYRSLSAIAREITGVAWSGPRFFGLGAGKAASHA